MKISDIKIIQEDIKHEVGIDLICSLAGKLTNIKLTLKTQISTKKIKAKN